MARAKQLKFDTIGEWSQIKLDILKAYEKAYSTILTKQKSLQHVYIDAFAGAGVHISKQTGDMVPGSPLNALHIDPPFREFFLIDLDSEKVKSLEREIGQRLDVHLFTGDCNKILIEDVFPKVRFSDFRRGLCFLDPYGLHLDWSVIETAGRLQSIDMFLNFPVMDMNRNALWRNPGQVAPADVARMNSFWGDDTWRGLVYQPSMGTFPAFGIEEKVGNEEIAAAFQQRLVKVAGFKEVPAPLPMRNTTGAIVYYLFFASQKAVARKIVEHIFDAYRLHGGH